MGQNIRLGQLNAINFYEAGNLEITRFTAHWKAVLLNPFYDTKLTELFSNMPTLKLKARPINAFFATVNQMFGGSSQLPTMLSELNSIIWFDYRALGSSRKLGGTAEHLIDGSEKRIYGSSF